MSAVVEDTIKHESTPAIEAEVTASPEESGPTPEVVPVEKEEETITTEEPGLTAEAVPAEAITKEAEPVVSPEEPAPVSDDLLTEQAAIITETTESAPLEEIKDVQNGSLLKRGPRPLRLWKNRYFAFHSEPIPLDQLRLVSKKYTKAVSASKEEFEKVNSSLFHDISSATVSGESLLFYYKSSNPDHVEVPLGIINLGNVESVSLTKAGKPHAFSIKTHSREYVLAASTADEAKSWVHSVQTKIDSLSSLPNLTETPKYKETYEKLVSRQAFNPKTTPPLPTGILSDNEILSGSDNEVENHHAEPQALVKEAETVPEVPVTEEAHATGEAHGTQPESPTLKSMFVNFKSFINKKTEKQPEAVAHNAEVSEVQAENTEPTSPVETPAEVAEVAPAETNDDAVVNIESPASEEKKEEHPARPLSFHLPKFFKGLMKDEKSETAVDQTETHTPEAEIVAETPIAETPVTETPAVEAVEETQVPATEDHEATPEQQAEVTRPGSPFKRTISSFLHLKKGKQVEAPHDSTEVEVPPPASESDNLEKPLDIVDNLGEAAVVPEAPIEERTPVEDTTEKPKKPTLFKRLSSMVRPITTPKTTSQSTTETSAPAIAQPLEAPIPEVNDELPAGVEPVKAN